MFSQETSHLSWLEHLVNSWHSQQLLLLKVRQKKSPRKKYSRKLGAFSFETL